MNLKDNKLANNFLKIFIENNNSLAFISQVFSYNFISSPTPNLVAIDILTKICKKLSNLY